MTSYFSESNLKIASCHYTIRYYESNYLYIQTTKFTIKIDLDKLRIFYELQLNKELNVDEFIQYKLPIICDDLFEFGSDIYSKEELEYVLNYQIYSKYNVVCKIVFAKNT